MDREAAVIRSEIDQTRVELDQKIARLEERARELHPRRYLPDYLLDRTIGATLTLIGACMAWSHWRHRTHRSARLRAELSASERW